MVFITFQLLLLVSFQWVPKRVIALDYIFTIISAALPGFFSLLLLLIRPKRGGPIYGSDGVWCWVSSEHQVIQVFALTVPQFISLIIVLASFGYMGRSIYEHTQKKDKQYIYY